VEHVQQQLGVSERRACRVLKQPRATQRYASQPADGEGRLTARVVELASQYGRYGYRRITALLRGEGWRVNHKRVERIWRREGLKVPHRQPKRGCLWLADGSCLNVIEEFTHECLAIRVARRLKAINVIDVPSHLFHPRRRARPCPLRQRPESVARAVQDWIGAVGAKTAYVAPGGRTAL
jgi:transposase InsO family protein